MLTTYLCSVSQPCVLTYSLCRDEDAAPGTASGMAFSTKQSGSELWSEPAPVPHLGLAINKKVRFCTCA